MRLLTAIYMYTLFVFCENSLPSPRDLKQSAPSLYLASQRSWPQGAEEKLEEKAHFWDNQTKHLLGLRFPLQHHARPDFSCERTSWKNEQDIKKKWKRERKKESSHPRCQHLAGFTSEDPCEWVWLTGRSAGRTPLALDPSGDQTPVGWREGGSWRKEKFKISKIFPYSNADYCFICSSTLLWKMENIPALMKWAE